VTGESESQADARVQAIIAANQAAPASPTAHAVPPSANLPADHLVANMPVPAAARQLH
jgi:hypothetical protein